MRLQYLKLLDMYFHHSCYPWHIYYFSKLSKKTVVIYF